jgi:phosphoribosylglycinamide formyltransferase-1
MALKVGVMASGRGSDFEAVAKAAKKGGIDVEVVVMITDKSDAGAIARAKKLGVEHVFVDPAKYSGMHDDAYFDAVDAEFVKRGVQLVVLAGWMKFIRSSKFIRKWYGKMINIHPSLLPKYPGRQGAKDAFDAGEKVSGYTIHFVDESVDGGPQIWQEKVDISGCNTWEEAAARILEREHLGLPMIVGKFAKGKYEITGHAVSYKPAKA